MFKKLAFLALVLLILWPSVASSQSSVPVANFGVERVWGFDNPTQTWKLYDPQAPQASDLKYFEAGKGYWVKTSQESQITYQGLTYPLYKGWNLIGWQASPVTQLRNPTYDELVEFLKVDRTDALVYNRLSFNCQGFALRLRDNAQKAGFRSAYVTVNFGTAVGEALNAFQTTDRGLVYVQSSGGSKEGTGLDFIVYLVVGEAYRVKSLVTGTEVVLWPDESITNIQVYW